ncbi:hypothetical protein TURU_068322 [Turdus rufiventris]|nr:hypothetical protein TURU_068322 [Turdus rufiventris]
MTPAIKHHLGKEVFAGLVREKMNGVVWVGWTLTLGTWAVRMILLAMLNTALLWFFWFTAVNPRAVKAPLLPGTCLSSALSPLRVFHLPLLDSRETSGSLPAFVNSVCKDNVCKTK